MSLDAHELESALKRWFGFDAFRAGQQAVVRDALSDHDLLAIMPTGGGKSLCFQLPALLRDGVSLVVSPLIALMQDQVRQLSEMGIAASFLNSSITAEELETRSRALLNGEYKLLYLAPERLLSPEFRQGLLDQLIAGPGINSLTVDEAHCVSEWGHDFRPEYRQIGALRQQLPDCPVFAFTATATERVRSDILSQLQLRDPALHVASFNRPNLYYAVRHKSAQSYAELRAQAQAGGAGIVYCLSRRRVDELAEKLRADGVTALPYHAGLDADTRRDHQERFIRDDAQVMVATVAFGMGINKPDVRWVTHFDLPRTIEGYYQEAGRAGRDGEAARCTLYFGPGDIRTAEFLIGKKVDPQSGEPLEAEQRIARHQLRQVLDYAESGECRRAVQLRYFGEAHQGACGACDNCCEPREMEDQTTEAQQLLSCVARLAQRGERFGAAHVIDILRGSENQKVLDRGHQQLSTYGIGKSRSQRQWRALLRSLLHQNLLQETHDGFPVLRLTSNSRAVLRGEQQVSVVVESEPASSGKRQARVLDNLDQRHHGLFASLRRLRKQLADAQQVPPYVVFSDASLREMAECRPTDSRSFARINGVGARKLEQYADAFIRLIAEHDQDE